VKAYYHARAEEYDEWWLNAARERPGWAQELDRITELLAAFHGRTLDVACGTGYITRHLGGEVTALDQSDAMIAIARERVPHATFVVGDALGLPFADQTFDRVFASYFYCHLEEEDRLRFVEEARRVAAELVVMGTIAQPGEPHAQWQERVLNDGSRWQVYKRVFDPDDLAAELGGEILHAGDWFVVARRS
jgi:ubiquinone/menaquinone biosynthesis C-methylase UbiE